MIRTILGVLIAGVVISAVQGQSALPPEVAAPDKTAVLTVTAVGVQVYECATDPTGPLMWRFREPVATLIADGKTVGRHYAGPTWELTDGSAVVGQPSGRAPGATDKDIPWLKLDVTTHRGSGQLNPVTVVQRLKTAGGVLSGTCDKRGMLRGVPYEADYVFLRDRG